MIHGQLVILWNIVVTLVLNFRKTLAYILSVNIFYNYSLFYQVNHVNALNLSSKVKYFLSASL